jgi:hypothetical protein
MQIKRLQAKGPEHKGSVWLDYEALYKGGHAFRDRVERFLPKNEAEHHRIYARRKKEAVFRSYIGTIVDYFAALLFAHELTTTPTRGESAEEVEPPDWAADFQTSADGAGTDLLDFVRDGFIDALVKGAGVWRLDFPDKHGTATDRAASDRADHNDVRLARVPREQLLDFERDDRGRLLWVILHEEDQPRFDPTDERGGFTRHRWWVLTRTHSRRFEVFVKKGDGLNPESTLQPAADVAHNLGEVPIVDLSVGDGLWVANRLESAQLEHFRLTCANNWSMRRTCYAMPLFRVTKPQEWRPGTMGAGYYLAIGENEHGEWMSPPTSHLSVVREEVASQKDEIFRLVSQMSLGVDNNAAAVGRSAESKSADAEAIQVVLRAYGAKVRDCVKRTMDLVSKARGDELNWGAEGLDRFETLDPELLVKLLKDAIALAIPSETFAIEAKTRAAHALLPGLDQATRDTIRKEVTEAVEKAASAPVAPTEDDPPDDATNDGVPHPKPPIKT